MCDLIIMSIALSCNGMKLLLICSYCIQLHSHVLLTAANYISLLANNLRPISYRLSYLLLDVILISITLA